MRGVLLSFLLAAFPTGLFACVAPVDGPCFDRAGLSAPSVHTEHSEQSGLTERSKQSAHSVHDGLEIGCQACDCDHGEVFAGVGQERSGHPDGGDCTGRDHCHHHGCGVHGAFSAWMGEAGSKLVPPSFVALGVVVENECVPDAPVRELDKPPLI